jgi:hypothetical protein
MENGTILFFSRTRRRAAHQYIKKKKGKNTPKQTDPHTYTNTHTQHTHTPKPPSQKEQLEKGQGQSVCQLTNTPTKLEKKLHRPSLSYEVRKTFSPSQRPQESFLPGQPDDPHQIWMGAIEDNTISMFPQHPRA